MSVEDVTFRCNRCGAREVIPVHDAVPWGADKGGELDKVMVNIPPGWAHRYGDTGHEHLDLCPGCVAERAKFRGAE